MATLTTDGPNDADDAGVEDATELTFDDRSAFQRLCGAHDSNLKVLASTQRVELRSRGNTLSVAGAEHDRDVAIATLEQLYSLSVDGHSFYPSDVRRAAGIVAGGRGLAEVFLDTVFVASGKRKISPKNLNQKLYIDAIRAHDLTFGIGPAGTGKTYLAMALAVAALSGKHVRRIILTRPAVEAGEKLGFLPGDMAEKVNPYLRPLYDALYDMLDVGKVQRLMDDQVIEVAPLAFMRGRTLNDAFVILDEAQNATREQMKMFLTRLGFNSKAVVTGDITQTDLEDKDRSGLVHAQRILQGVPGISLCTFSADDVVRHNLVMRIIRAYDSDSNPSGD